MSLKPEIMSELTRRANLTRKAHPEFDEVFFTVEADSFSQMKLWSENDQSREHKLPWEQKTAGYAFQAYEYTIGEETLPVMVSVFFSKYGGKMICFYDSPGRLVDWSIVEKFVELLFVNRAGRCDAMNFHHCYHAVKDASI